MINNSFEEQWLDDVVLSTKNQIPNGWNLTYIPIGVELRSAGVFDDVDDEPLYEVSRTIPECVLKGLFGDVWNLPENERVDGENALILDGVRVYKCFSNYNPFGIQLEQTVYETPGTTIRLTWPVNVHNQGDGSPGAATWRIGINDTFCDWKTFKEDFEDRTWTIGVIEIKVPDDGKLVIKGQFESRSIAGIDFFMDDIRLETTGDIIENGKPRVQYERTYVLLPSKDKATKKECLNAFTKLSNEIHDQQWTVGFSADDAGIGALDIKNVIVIKIHEDDWDDQALLDFFNTYYPGTNVSFYTFSFNSHFPVGTDQYPPRYWYVPTSQLFTPTHFGVDLNLDISPYGDVERGFPIYSVLDGVVTYTTDNWSGVGMCVIKHELDNEEFWCMYAHVDLLVTTGQQVSAGTVIGRIANWTGGDGGDHLHFGVSTEEVERQYSGWDYWIDPVEWLKRFISPEIVDASIAKGDHITPVEPPAEEIVLRSNNTIGLHSGFSRAKTFEYITDSKTNIHKFFSAGDAYLAAKEKNIVSIWRKYVGNEQGRIWQHGTIRNAAQWYLDLYTAELETARKNMGLSLEQFLENRICIESLNETIPSYNVPVLEDVVEFDVHFCDLAHERYGESINTVLLCGAIGNPAESEVKYLLPAAKIATDWDDFIGYHCYWTATAERSFLTEHWKYHAGRWTEWDNYFTSQGVYVKYASGEGGIVYSPSANGTSFDGGKGWKSCGSFARYLQDINTFNTLVLEWNKTHNNRMAGLTLFCYGQWGWDDFELDDGEVQLLLNWSKSV